MSLQRRTKLGLLSVAFLMGFALAPAERGAVYAGGATAMDDEEVTLTGCVIRGDDDGKGLLLTNVLPASIDMSTRAAQSGQTGTAGAAGTLAGASNVIYWLDDLEDDDDLPDYAGKRVEVQGEVDGDVDRGEMEIEREGDWVEIEIKSDGKEVKTRIPYASVMPNPSGSSPAVGTSGGMKDDDEIELNINVRKLDVKNIRVVSGTCQ